jgi:hypothetical protein
MGKMSMSKASNGIATADDFRKAAETQFEEPQLVTLPKLGKKVLMRRPTPSWMIFNGRLPVTMAARLSNATDTESARAESIVSAAEWMFKLVNAVMVKPRCVLNPKGNDEISPDLIDMEDIQFIMAWAAGEEVDEANNLNTFRGKRGTSDTRPTRGGLEL